jgi:hypothetical protein
MKHGILKTAHPFAFIRVDSWLLNPNGRVWWRTEAYGRVITRANGYERQRTDADHSDRIQRHRPPINAGPFCVVLGFLAAIAPSLAKKSMQIGANHRKFSANYRKSALKFEWNRSRRTRTNAQEHR